MNVQFTKEQIIQNLPELDLEQNYYIDDGTVDEIVSYIIINHPEIDICKDDWGGWFGIYLTEKNEWSGEEIINITQEIIRITNITF